MSETLGGSIRYQPGDCVLLVGPAELLFKRQEALPVAGLRPALFCTAPGDAGRLTVGQRALAGLLTEATGWMGAFRARMAGPERPVDLAPLSWHVDGHFDWILDFAGGLFSDYEVTPPGYYRLGADDFSAFKGALLEIAARRREGYEKPRYFRFDEALCAHRRQGVAGCSACLPACATGAIAGGGDSVRIEAHLCQGCAACALVCPSGAIRYAEPDTLTSLNKLRGLLSARPSPAGLWIRTEDGDEEAPPAWLDFPVAQPFALGCEFWLGALALGCGRVALSTKSAPDRTRNALVAQMELARALLAGLGQPPAIAAVGSTEAAEDLPAMIPPVPIALPDTDDKRILLEAAVAALMTESETGDPIIPLPPGAPWGALAVDTARCTLCSACIRVCPTEALETPGARNQLAFTESRCVQCGLCASACPEEAVTLQPRLLRSTMARLIPRVVVEAEMYSCKGCGIHFAPRAMIEKGRVLMAGHPMFQGERARLMSLCPDCRQKAMAGLPV